MKKILLPLLCGVLCLHVYGDTRLSYRIESGSWPEPQSREVIEKISGDQIEFSSSREWGEFVLLCTAGGDTLRYMMRSYESGTVMEARREGNSVVVEAEDKGEKVRETLMFEKDLPWYQSFDHQFFDFALSGERKREFYMIRPDKLSLTVWQLKRVGVETIETPGGAVEAVRVKVSPSGMFSVFWSAECWYRLSDGRFLRYEGPMGGPGSDVIVSLLAGEENL
ncbi:MAG: hypothetical protein JXB03_08020 [Spirochaetales bacterium]|nr:hypothetical protein [Spirochaetales bacterium]